MAGRKIGDLFPNRSSRERVEAMHRPVCWWAIGYFLGIRAPIGAARRPLMQLRLRSGTQNCEIQVQPVRVACALQAWLVREAVPGGSGFPGLTTDAGGRGDRRPAPSCPRRAVDTGLLAALPAVALDRIEPFVLHLRRRLGTGGSRWSCETCVDVANRPDAAVPVALSAPPEPDGRGRCGE